MAVRGRPRFKIPPFRHLGLILAASIVGFVCAAVYIGTLLIERQSTVDPLGRRNVTWLIAQTPSEYARLQQWVAAYGMGSSQVDAAEVLVRLAVVENRARMLRSPFLDDFLASSPRHGETLAALDATLASARPLIEAFDDPAAAAGVLEILEPVFPRLVRLSVDANAWNAVRLDAERGELLRLQRVFATVAAGLVLCGFTFIALLMHNNRLLNRTYGALRRKEQDLQQQNSWFEAALNNMSQALCLTDSTKAVLVYNERFSELFKVAPPPALQGSAITMVLPAAFTPADARESGKLAPPSGSDGHVHRLADGRVIYVSHAPMTEGGWVSTFEDITERQRVQDHIAHMAHHDALTTLPNRLKFWAEVEAKLQELKSGGAGFAILYLDLDRFKEVNDTLGHPTGDALLQLAAQRLKGAAGSSTVVARLGGDEFGVLHGANGDATDLARRLIGEISRPFVIDGKEVRLTTSIGIALAPQDGLASDLLVKNADLALYRAKAMGANTYQFFDPEMEKTLWRRRSLEDDLRSALSSDQLQVHFQPLVSLAEMRIVCGEALLRWNHPVHGAVPPAEFIPIAEEIGCIDALGEWVMRQAFKEASKWPEDVRVAVNLSPVQFKDARLYDRIVSAAADAGLRPERAELEITESVLLQDTEVNIEILDRFRELGFAIALDDFGTGYSSLSYLLRFPFDKLKIDRCFIRDLAGRGQSLTIVRSVITLARRLGMRTTAEGVETLEQLEIVQEAGCTEAQGFFINRPLTADEFRALLTARTARVQRPAKVSS